MLTKVPKAQMLAKVPKTPPKYPKLHAQMLTNVPKMLPKYPKMYRIGLSLLHDGRARGVHEQGRPGEFDPHADHLGGALQVESS